MSSEEQSQLLSTLHRAVRLFIAGSSLFGQRVAEKVGLHPTDMQFLNLLDLLGPMTPGALAQRSGLSSGGVTVVVDRLEKAGYVKRTANPEDRRSLLVSVQRARQKRITANYESAQEQLGRALKQFTEGELETVLRFFAAVNARRPTVKIKSGGH